jgi:hypothetical protein
MGTFLDQLSKSLSMEADGSLKVQGSRRSFLRKSLKTMGATAGAAAMLALPGKRVLADGCACSSITYGPCCSKGLAYKNAWWHYWYYGEGCTSQVCDHAVYGCYAYSGC